MARKAEEGEAYSQLATRIPKELHRRLRLHCVTENISMMEFVIAGIREKLAREKKRGVPGE